MKYSSFASWRTLIIIYVICLQISCAKDADLLSEYVINETIAVEKGINFENAIKIPSDFDWSNISSEYENQVLEINDIFDLKGQNIVLPSNVTLYFNGGHFENGTIEGDETFIYSDSGEPIVTDVSFTGTYENEYVKPHWFGAVMDGVTDDRDAFVETLAYADSLNLKVLVDHDMFLDVEETGKKSIFLEDNTWIEGADNARIIVNNLLSPAFIVALAENITLKNITIYYDQIYDAAFGYNHEMSTANVKQIEDYLVANRGLVFVNQDPVWRGQVSFRYTILLEAARNVLFENVSMISKGKTADSFMIGAIKLKEEYDGNQIVSDDSGHTSICNSIVFNNLVIDGAIMGIQGIVDNLTIDGLNSYRYSDVQTLGGSMVGGVNYWMPPPHLIYLNKDNSNNFISKNINILNTIDYGNYVGTTAVRKEISGYCNSLKLVDFIENVVVDNYASYRRDGLGDWGDISNGHFSNIYAESSISIFDPNYKYYSLRFLGTLTNTTITNMTIKDNSEKLSIYPLDIITGDNNLLDGVQLVVNVLNNSDVGPFGFSGSHNSVVNSSLTILDHTSTDNYETVIYSDNETRQNGQENFYDIVVYGWRAINAEPLKKSIRVLLDNSPNLNSNYAIIRDVANNYIIEQTNNIKKDIWTRSELVKLGSGKSQILSLNIPTGYTIQSITASTIENLTNDIDVFVGTSNSNNNLLNAVSKTVGEVSNTINGDQIVSGFENIYINSNKDFGNKGKIMVTINLIRVSEGE